MNKQLALCLLLCGSTLAHAYQAGELREDCQIAENMLSQQSNLTPYDSLRGTRCISYLAGFADGYAVADYLGGKVGLQLGAFCLPKEENLPPRMVRALLAQFDRMPPRISQGTAEIAAAAFARSFPCNEKLETK
ncbi:Rap1a/Tai family immunity protein [Dechloromonas sp. ZY10]|uniref:Rap1a/Tai family immunity protein n=1 Tax=Dechloromonas aquae TaxID=2664436 RepID=UPI003527D247